MVAIAPFLHLDRIQQPKRDRTFIIRAILASDRPLAIAPVVTQLQFLSFRN
ncbi:MAG: hypothetical protein HC899_33885 [Leptolyngbyaceae cyanobacterium SM1_4_3]|nr:hypothetical protein [Leptolyngbyaceae cyanobacterium SM1_4_3]